MKDPGQTDRSERHRIDLFAPALAAVGAVVAIDQASKALATSLVSRGESTELLPFLSIANTRNKGVAFGLGGDISSALIGVAVLLLIGLLVYLASRARDHALAWIPGALLIGGALGNLADRVRDDAVTDFIDLPVWPTFNLADVTIVAGVLLLFVEIERSEAAARRR